MCVCERERVCVCVCVRERERERESLCERERDRARESTLDVCMCVLQIGCRVRAWYENRPVLQKSQWRNSNETYYAGIRVIIIKSPAGSVLIDTLHTT